MLSSSYAGPVYTWSDAAGITHFSDKPPADETLDVHQFDYQQPAVSGGSLDDDYYSIARQLERMEARRLASEAMTIERLRAQAEADRAQAEARAAESSDSQDVPEEVRYLYPYFPHPGLRPPYRYPHPHSEGTPGTHDRGHRHRPSPRMEQRPAESNWGAPGPKIHRVPYN